MKKTSHPLPFRIGHGYDVHAFAVGRPLILGGVSIPHDKGLQGHSDADVLSHAIADAVLGAMGLPDIGHYFPNSDASIAGIDSLQIIARAVEEVGKRGYTVGNVDTSLIAEAPKIGPWLASMKDRLSTVLGIGPESIGIKATTHEKLGALGRAEGISAHAVCLLMRS